jgi:LPXTG-site transpeptidase (sortase) family protein
MHLPSIKTIETRPASSDALQTNTTPDTSSGGPSLRARVVWTLGNLLMLAGLYILLYVSGVYAWIEYHRLAARGDTDLPAPRVLTQPVLQGGTVEISPAFKVPVLNTGDPQARTVASSTADEPASTISRIILPAIDVDSKVIEVGWEVQEQDGQEVAVWQVAEYAVGHHMGSANPGEGGNVVLAGHVGGYGKVFLDLFYVEPGDEVILYSKGQQYLYTVHERLVVDEEGVPFEQRVANARYIEPTDEEVVTLVTCWPPSGKNRFEQRVIIRAWPYETQQPEQPEDQPDGSEMWTVR